MSLTPASEHEIVQTFLRIPFFSLHHHNWRTAEDHDDLVLWDVTTGTYINGVILTLDQDSSMGYLIEVIDVETDAVTYAVVVTYSGQGHDSAFMPGPLVGGRFIGQEDAAQWGVRAIFGLMESREDGLAEERVS